MISKTHDGDAVIYFLENSIFYPKPFLHEKTSAKSADANLHPSHRYLRGWVRYNNPLNPSYTSPSVQNAY